LKFAVRPEYQRRHKVQTMYDEIISNCKTHDMVKVSDTPFPIETIQSLDGEPTCGIQYKCKNCWYTEYKQVAQSRLAQIYYEQSKMLTQKRLVA
jgi:hypothetical protein